MVCHNNINRSLVSVVIPAYNHQDYIQETIDSIVNQSYQDIELIVINDGSTDCTEKRIIEMEKECNERFVKYTFISNKNKGVAETLNEGLKNATGEFFYLIASDDIAYPHAIETLVNTLDSNDEYGLAVGDNSIIDGAGTLCYWDKNRTNVYNKSDAIFTSFAEFLKLKRKDINFTSKSFGCYGSLLKGNYIPNGYLVRKILMDDFGGFSKEAPLEDHYLMMQLSKTTRLKYVDTPLFSYRWHGANSITNTERMAEFGLKTLMIEKDYANYHGFGKLWKVVCGEQSVKLFDYKFISAILKRRKIKVKLFGIIKFNIGNTFYINYLDNRHSNKLNQ